MNELSQEQPNAVPTRRSLLERLKNWEDAESWQTFFDTYWRLIYGVALRSGLTEDEAEEVMQETLLHVAKKMKGFTYDPSRGSFKSWLLQATRWRIRDQFRKRKRAAPASPSPKEHPDACAPSGEESMDEIADPKQTVLETVWDEEWRKNLVDRATERLKRYVSPKHYQVFDLYVQKGHPVATVARTLGIRSSQVYVIKHRVSKMLKQEIEALQKELL